MKSNRYIRFIYWLLMFYIPLLILGVIIINSISFSGKEVVSYKYIDSETFIKPNEFNTVEYQREGDYLLVDRVADSKGFLFVLNDASSNSSSYVVEQLDSDMEIIRSDDIAVKAGKRVVQIDSLEDGTRFLKVCIDDSVRIFVMGFYNTYASSMKPAVIVIWLFISLLIAILIYYVKKLSVVVDKITSAYKTVYKAIRENKRRILSLLVLTFIEVIASSVIMFILDKIGFHGFLIESYPVQFNWKTVTWLALILLLVSIVIVYRDKLDKNIPLFASICLLIIGLMYVFLVPVTCGVSWDDETHYNRAMILSHKIDDKSSFSDRIIIDRFVESYGSSKALVRDNCDKNEGIYNEIDALGFTCEYVDDDLYNYRIPIYIPICIGLIISRGLGLPYSICFLCGRLTNLLLFVILCYISMRVLKFGNILVYIIATVPTSIFLASGYSYDAWLSGLVILGYAFLFSIYQSEDETIPIKYIFIIPLVFFLAVLEKKVYFILIFPALLISSKRFSRKRDCILYRVMVSIAALSPFYKLVLGQIIHASSEGDPRGTGVTSPTSQLDYIFANKFEFISNFVKYLIHYLNPFEEYMDYTNNVGYTSIAPTEGLLTLVFVLLAFVVFHEDSKKTISIFFRFVMLMLYIGIGALAAFSMYILFTDVGSDSVAGCQGRYLIPVFFPLLYSLTRVPKPMLVIERIGMKKILMTCFIIPLLISSFCLWWAYVVYY